MVEEDKLIPKTVHYFWFSNDPLPEKLQLCFDSWEKNLSGYEIKKWDLTNTPINSSYAKRALQEKKWAFLTDYCRLWVLYHHGGIYLDADMLVVKPFDSLLGYSSFWGMAEHGMVEPVVIGARKGNLLVQRCLEQYEEPWFEEKDFIEIPLVILPVFEKVGFKKGADYVQELEGGVVLPQEYFCPLPFKEADSGKFLGYNTDKTIAVHLWNSNWFDPFRFFWSGRRKAGWRALWSEVRKNPFQSLSFYKNVLYHLRKSNLK